MQLFSGPQRISCMFTLTWLKRPNASELARHKHPLISSAFFCHAVDEADRKHSDVEPEHLKFD